MATPFIWQHCFLVALPRPEDLLLCAKHLFVAAMRPSSEPRAQGRAMATSATLPGGKEHQTAGASRAAARRGKRHTRTRVLLRLDFRFVYSYCPDGHLSVVVDPSNPP